MNKVFIKACSVLGAAALCVAPAVIDTSEGKILAMAGLSMLTVQAIDLRAWNLVILNTAGIIGYSFSLWG